MKFHALTLCLAGTLATSGAYAQDRHNNHQMHNDRMQNNRMQNNRSHGDRMHNMHSNTTARTDERVDRSSWPLTKPFNTDSNWEGKRTRNSYTQRFPHYKESATAYGPVMQDWLAPNYIAYYPDLPSLSEVARKIADIHHQNAMEAAEVRALAGRARALGWTNIAAVYDQIASDHGRGATMAANWLTDQRFPVPAMPTTTTVSDNMSETDVRNSVDRLLDMHVRMYNETTDKLHNEKSSTVRGMYLMQLTTMARHIDLLEQLDQDVEGGRRDLSNRLAAQLDATRTTRTAREWDTMIFQEEWARYQTTSPTTVASGPYVVPADAEIQIVERPVIVERIVERPVPATQPTFTAPSTPQPVIEQPQTTVAGRRETRPRRPARRPAK